MLFSGKEGDPPDEIDQWPSNRLERDSSDDMMALKDHIVTAPQQMLSRVKVIDTSVRWFCSLSPRKPIEIKRKQGCFIDNSYFSRLSNSWPYTWPIQSDSRESSIGEKVAQTYFHWVTIQSAFCGKYDECADLLFWLPLYSLTVLGGRLCSHLPPLLAPARVHSPGPPLRPKFFYISAQHHPLFSRSLLVEHFIDPFSCVGRFFPVKHLTNETCAAHLFLLQKHFSIFGIHTTGLGQSAVEARNARTRISFGSASWPSSQMPVRSLVTGAPVPACCVCHGEVTAFVHIVRLWIK